MVHAYVNAQNVSCADNGINEKLVELLHDAQLLLKSIEISHCEIKFNPIDDENWFNVCHSVLKDIHETLNPNTTNTEQETVSI